MTYPNPKDQKVQESLKQSEERYRTLVANIPGAVYRCACDSDRKMAFLSEAIEDISGYPPSDFINNRVRSFGSIIHPQDRANVDQVVWQNARLKHSYVIEYRIVRADGTLVWVYDKGQAIFSDTGEILWLDGVILDISDRKQIEAQLHCTQGFLNSVIDNLPVGVYIKDAEKLRILYWNKASERIFGYSKAAVLGKNDYDFLPQQQARYLRAKDRQVLAGGQLIESLDETTLAPYPEKRFLYTQKIPLFDETDTPQYLLVICEDITERKRVEAALRESEAHYRSIVETASEGVWIFNADSQTTFANTPMAQMLGYQVEEMLGRSLFDFMDEESRALADAYVERRRQGFHERHDFRFRRKDGSELWAIVSAMPIFDADNQFVGVLRMITDISDRKQAEAQLQEREEFLRSIYDGIESSIFVVDVQEKENSEITTEASEARTEEIVTSAYEFRYRGLNPAHERLIGIQTAELQGKTPEEVLPPPVAAALHHRYEQCVRAETPIRYEECLLLNGKDTWWLTTLTPLRNEQGRIYRLVGTSTTISDRKQALEALQQSESRLKAKNQQLKQALRKLKQAQAQLIQNEKMISLGQMVAGIAHEINNPISFIYGNVNYACTYATDLLHLVELYSQHYPEPVPEITHEIDAINLNFIKTDFPKLFKSMTEGAERIHSLVLSLRNFSRLDEAEMKAVNIHEGIDSSLLILQHRLKKRPSQPEIQVIKEYGQLPPVECYPSQLNQVFINLLSNAIDALESESDPQRVSPSEVTPTITIHTEVKNQNTRPNSEQVIIRITDNGPGISKAVKKRIFDPFFTTKPVGVGTGLGLSISHSIIVEKHRGHLTCVSAPGKGAEFIIELPMKQKR
ncbi:MULTISPECIES: PAS domain S-box protein [unclassified Coleofasciculus]|uniref:PAS domain S-box protein n=1 Tax=unclassified Coleofasciculus TaxID=2692782 RepID=UPI00187ED66A|nr:MULTISPECIES: PAS domain S-box protein [unclassified Coleofasciculus]MBE9125556.1 PAS domain S-box protein [Coleofasciculus sp. LEGE 07081]MBE9147809.1 PAS domain S-box protein [Coleofasciculus sp. LEGE 07092]